MRRRARSLYGSIVTQARSPGAYARWGVPDTPEGRFEMIALHLALALDRLAREAGSGYELGQALTEAFVVDVDDTLREMTVGDLAVPKQVKRAVAVLYDRCAAYGAALDANAGEGLLDAAVKTRLGGLRGAEGLDAAQICAYIRAAARALERQAAGRILEGRIAWPPIDAGSESGPDAG